MSNEPTQTPIVFIRNVKTALTIDETLRFNKVAVYTFIKNAGINILLTVTRVSVGGQVVAFMTRTLKAADSDRANLVAVVGPGGAFVFVYKTCP